MSALRDDIPIALQLRPRLTFVLKHDNILVVERHRERTDGGLVIPETSSRTQFFIAGHTVAGIGPGAWKQGGFVKPDLEVGQHVMIQPAWLARFKAKKDTVINGVEVRANTWVGVVPFEAVYTVVEGESEDVPIGDVEDAEGYVE
jgi:co-chaperonin GroES (HSP10)